MVVARRASWHSKNRCKQGRRIRGFEGARAPPGRRSAPSHCQKHPLKVKEYLIKHRFKPISIKVMVALTFILGLYLCKTAVIYYFALKWTATSGKAPPRVSTILHPWLQDTSKTCAEGAIRDYLHIRSRSWSWSELSISSFWGLRAVRSITPDPNPGNVFGEGASWVKYHAQGKDEDRKGYDIET